MRNCPACRSRYGKMIGPLENTMPDLPGPQSYDLISCQACDTIYLSPMISDDVMREMYCNRTQFNGGVYENIDPILEYYRNVLISVRQSFSIEHLRILEVGAGLAWVCRAAKMLDKNSLAHAQDITAETVTDCNWVDSYHVGQIDNLDDNYNLISLTHVIEHLPDPGGIIRTLRQKLHNGVIFLTAPHRPITWDGSIESWRSWAYNHTPAHLTYFSESGLRLLANSANLKVSHFSLAEDGQAFECWLCI